MPSFFLLLQSNHKFYLHLRREGRAGFISISQETVFNSIFVLLFALMCSSAHDHLFTQHYGLFSVAKGLYSQMTPRALRRDATLFHYN